LSGDPPATKESAIQALDGILTALDTVELQVNVALRVWI
jgi:hypothetical protein